MRSILIALLITSVALAGCSKDSGDTADPMTSETTTSTGTSTTSTSSSTTTTTGPAPAPGDNRAPSATLTASVEQGETPVEVLFTMEGSDPDGDALTWTFDADSDGTFESEGTELPTNFTHSYTTEGLHNATFVVSDGELEATRSIVINATAAAAGPPDFATIIISGSISGLWVPEAGYLGDPNVHAFEVPGVASAIDFLLEWGTGAIDLDFEAKTPSGKEAGGAAEFNDLVLGNGLSSEAFRVEDGALLAEVGTWSIEVIAASALMADYTATITFTP